MRCWECHNLILVPDHPPGAVVVEASSRGVVITCSRCRARYDVTTRRLGKAEPKPDTRTEAQKAEDETWRR